MALNIGKVLYRLVSPDTIPMKRFLKGQISALVSLRKRNVVVWFAKEKCLN